MILANAQSLANLLVDRMSPYTERIAVAGSIRRLRPEVKDVEIVAIPKWTTRAKSNSLFGEQEQVNLLCEWATQAPGIRWIKTGTSDIQDWQIKPEGSYWRGLLEPLAFGINESKIKLDLFLAKPNNWGAILLIRTGSADFNVAIMKHARSINRPCDKGYFYKDGEPYPTPEELDVFELLNLEFVAPSKRFDESALKGRLQSAQA